MMYRASYINKINRIVRPKKINRIVATKKSKAVIKLKLLETK